MTVLRLKLPPRALPPSWLLPAWSSRQLHHVRRFAQHLSRPENNNSNSRKARSTRSAASLLEELFPEEARIHRHVNKPTTASSSVSDSSSERDDNSHEDQFPRLSLDDVGLSASHDSSTAIDNVTGWRGEKASHKWKRLRERQRQEEDFRREDTTILVLYSASKSLNEDDFRRLSPSGKHIDGWRNMGDIAKIIPGRDPKTLRQQEHYYLIFSRPASAAVYEENVQRLHKMAKTHAPHSPLSTIAPPPGYLIDGEDAYALLQSYAVIPPWQDLNLRMLVPPMSKHVNKLLQHGGYEALTEGNKAGRAVLFSVEGYSPSTGLVRDTLAREERVRGLAWELDREDGAEISKLTNSGPVPMPEPEADTDDLSGQAVVSQDQWIITFKREVEARRFVRAWHRRAFPIAKAGPEYEDAQPLVDAQLLW
ncbi:hypothetical protein L228DRAFT_248984 [Xylona heveae TC161]|uniref:Uncharacterized protein n=1 Tax=Xylona heveae (strain CBS 132557 / TC161) TaxID=1328760 RepID=A0A165FNV4_XYLHT|nr:hypothetical protein L228DRAFT_248984 [Xylona heveae TC161]KZF21203.1 hypothetical protein L228DRAFT_248984 [Xylona heveae TC161]